MSKTSNESKSNYFKAGEVIGIAFSAAFWIFVVMLIGAVGRVLYEIARLGFTGFYFF